ncbi:MAG: DNA mismatch repair protein MutS [Methanobacteriota archaeon]
MATKTPLVQQYESIKAQHPDALLLFRLGDFYETFGEDAKVASKVLGIVLTSRDKGAKEKVPLAGIPHHALDSYLGKLIRAGHKVAICEQMEEASAAKGIVRREVVRVVTPGTLIEDSLLDGKVTNYLLALAPGKGGMGVAFADSSTGEMVVTEASGAGWEKRLCSEISLRRPSEIVTPDGKAPAWLDLASAKINAFDRERFELEKAEWLLLEHFKADSMEALGLEGKPLAAAAAGAALAYVAEMQRGALGYFAKLRFSDLSGKMSLDPVTLRNLEILENIRERGRDGTLLETLDHTKSPPGARTLRAWLQEPLLDPVEVNRRLDSVEALKSGFAARDELRATLANVRDMDRLVSRACFGTASPSELVGLASSLRAAKKLRNGLSALAEKTGAVGELAGRIDPCEELDARIARTVCEEPPATMDDGGYVRPGFSAELDGLRRASRGGREWIVSFEAKERERTGVKSLKVGFTRIFGYYIEVSKPNLKSVPEDYERKQTIANGERFTTRELKEAEQKVLTAEEDALALERKIFSELRKAVGAEAARVQATSRALGELDALCSLAHVADRNGYVRPRVDSSETIKIVDGRHPVVELALSEKFVPNDALLDCTKNRLMMITGPNMAGKSTFMRQVALVCYMAQVGSFVPARAASVGIVDRIFTRVGAYDDLARGQSSFMVEMTEVANILHSATKKSLILLDEIGRGTSTFDGLCIAWAVAEYVHGKKVGAKTMFATHYHDLTGLEGLLPGVVNYNIAVREDADDIVFMRKVIPGGTNRSYGVQVAKLAGMPPEVVARARELLREMESTAPQRGGEPGKGRTYTQLVLFDGPGHHAAHPVVEELRGLDIHNMTPVQALQKLDELKRKVCDGKSGKVGRDGGEADADN